MRTLVQVLQDGNFVLVDVPEQRDAGFAPLTPSLTAQDLRDELLHRGVPEEKLDEVINLAKQRGTASW